MNCIQMKTFALGPLETNCYLVWQDSEALMIDAGGDPAEVVDFLRQNNLTLTHILLTHLHFDHCYGVQALCDAVNGNNAQNGAAPVHVLAHKNDMFMRTSPLGMGGKWGLPTVPPYHVDAIETGTQCFAGMRCHVLETPGHSAGSVSFYFPDMPHKADDHVHKGAVFAGDLLFYHAVGRTDLESGDQDTLVASVQKQIFLLPEDTLVYPGHGIATSVGAEKLHNPYMSSFAE